MSIYLSIVLVQFFLDASAIFRVSGSKVGNLKEQIILLHGTELLQLTSFVVAVVVVLVVLIVVVVVRLDFMSRT